MPTNHIISRIQSIESRISEIQNFGNSSIKKKSTSITESRPNGDSFSEILNEVVKSKELNQLSMLDDSSNTITPNKLLNSKIDTLLDQYKKTGTMPTSQPSPLPQNIIHSTNRGTWDHIVEQAAKSSDIDPRLIHAVIQAESAYNPNAVSRVGAEGLMQLMPYTAESIGVTDSFDPQQNIFGGTKVLREMLDRYDGDLVKALAAYNAGPEAVDRANGVPNYKETQEYVPRVLNYYYNLR